jgi:hypothetical protein
MAAMAVSEMRSFLIAALPVDPGLYLQAKRRQQRVLGSNFMELLILI